METPAKRTLSRAERYARRSQRKEKNKSETPANGALTAKAQEKEKLVKFLGKNEGELLKFVVKVNRLYEEKLKKPAPFMTFVLVGMQSSGKSTFMERLLNAVLNIVQENTGTRCPLDVTCIYDEDAKIPCADLSGEELESGGGEELSVDEVFEQITNHNKMLADEDRFSTKCLTLVYKADNVQNMRFVDTPGVITNKSIGKDNREDIKRILRDEMGKPNTKLCVLLEATEFAKNPIVDFLDESLDGRDGWIKNSTFLMTKFDKQIQDSRTASKANTFFSEFKSNGIVPHLVITPTLAKEDLEADELFKARNELLARSNEYEREQFYNWRKQHEQYRQEHNSDDFLDEDISKRVGFPTAHSTMHKDMLEHTLATLPTVVGSIQKDLAERNSELQVLKEKQKFTDPAELRMIVKDMVFVVQERLTAYLDGDLLSAMKFQDKLQTLEEEIDEEEDSYWATADLNFHTEKEDQWRSHIADMDELPEEVQADKQFLGGKQVHRAIEFFRYVMIDSLPDPYLLEELVPNAVGYGGGGLMRENWEGATKQICMVLMKDVTHPGINYLVKHIGYILRNLFHIAVEDIKNGHAQSKTFRLIPDVVDSYITKEFDKMLWDLMKTAADKIHTALEPLYSTIDPTLPTFVASEVSTGDEGPAEVKEDDESKEESLVSWAKSRLLATMTGSGEEAKRFLKRENRARAESKKAFLRDERTSMIRDEETKIILDRSFQYLVALMEYSSTSFRLQINHFLYESFKKEMKQSFVHKASETDWSELIEEDPAVVKRIEELEDQIKALESSQQDVHRMMQKLA